MQKMVFGRKLGRGRKAREALIKSVIRAFVASGKMTTTKAKAKFVLGEIDKLVSLAKINTVHNQRIVLAKLGNDRKTTNDLFTKIAPKFTQRKSGFTKIIPLSQRVGDRAEMVRLEWTEKVETSDKKQATSKKENKNKDENLPTNTKRN